jgi:hypothetical protein
MFSCTIKQKQNNISRIKFTDSAVIVGNNIIIKNGTQLNIILEKYILRIIVDTTRKN